MDKEDSTIDDIMYHLYVKKKILAGLKDLDREKEFHLNKSWKMLKRD